MTLTIDIKKAGSRQSCSICAPFDQGLDELTREGYQLTGLAENARLRIQEGPNQVISANGNYVREGIIYRPNEKSKLVRISPIIYSPKEATQAHSKGKGSEFFPSNEAIEKALEESLTLPEHPLKVPTLKLNSEEVMIFSFGEKLSREYGEFLHNNGIKDITFCIVNQNYINSQSQSFARQGWLSRLQDSSTIDFGRGIHEPFRVRGIN